MGRKRGGKERQMRKEEDGEIQRQMGRERKEKQNTDGEGERGGKQRQMRKERDAEIQRLFREKDGEIQRQMERIGKERRLIIRQKRREELSNCQDSLHYTNLLTEIPSSKIFCERNDNFQLEVTSLCSYFRYSLLPVSVTL
jgi:hypothetical protein